MSSQLRAAGRLAVLSGHWPVGQDLACAPLSHQACAAHQLIRFARPAAPDVRYGRAAAATPSDSDLEMMGRAVAVLSAAAAEAQPGAGAGAPPSPPPTTESPAERLEHPPRFGRPVALRQPATSPFSPPQRQPLVPAHSRSDSGAGGEGTPLAAPPQRALHDSVQLIPGAAAAPASPWRPEMNVLESEYGWVVELALPGVRPEEVRVELAGRTLAVSGRRAPAAAAGGTGLLPDLASLLPAVFGLPGGSGRAVRQELATGAFAARWLLPEGANADSVQAMFQNGVLRIRVAKQGVFTLA